MNLMKKKKYLPVILLILFAVGCEKNTTELIGKDESNNSEGSYELSDIKNIIWTLEFYEMKGQAIELSSYAPFHLAFDDSLFFGDDGCNHYGGLCRTTGDSVVPLNCWITEIACSNISSASWWHLTFPYKYEIRLKTRELTLYTGDSKYIYKSNFLEDVDSLLIDKTWSLTSNPLVTLFFDKTRKFQAEYNCDAGDDSGCGTTWGIYGIGDGNSILFYGTGSSGYGSAWLDYLKSILRSSAYSVENSSLILSNADAGTAFKFSKEE